MLSHLYSLHPWQYVELTKREFDGYVAQAEAELREVRRASSAAR